MSRLPSVAIERKLYDIIGKFCTEAGSSLKSMTNSIINDYINRRNLAAEFANEIAFVGISSNRITLRDQETAELVDVYYVEKFLYCEKDKTNFCQHTYFTLLLPELEQLKK
jgi:hypothetical protein